MFEKALLVIGLILIGYVLYPLITALLNKYYYKVDSFQSSPPTVNVNTPGVAPISMQPPSEPPRVVSQSGPAPPNKGSSPDERAALSPEETPRDPYDEVNSELPLNDNMRKPERSFGPGVNNTGTKRSVSAGTAAEAVNSSLDSFSPEFAQNGGNFMEGISANDMGAGSEYATI
uniref:Uncharacterized protein n=1 Tax=viral metagenome TaxID=1070528 RepID=A0A6C0JYE8_9ZZZZ